MCVSCGCGVNVEHAHEPGHEHGHSHGPHPEHDPGHEHEHVVPDGTRFTHSHAPQADHLQARPLSIDVGVAAKDSRSVQLEARILDKNQRLADRNRLWLSGRGIVALNLLSSPGAGKTTLLERTLRDLQSEIRISVIEGDQATSADAQRIRATGVKAVQVNTGTGCHLEADMLQRALQLLEPERDSLLVIENVGNLVCPALFDLGERLKVVMFSVPEGEDKPLKYPHMFSAADVLVLSKIDLLPYVNFDRRRALDNALKINPRLRIFELSASSGEGLAAWYGWLREEMVSGDNRP